MSSYAPPSTMHASVLEAANLRKCWIWFLILGIALILLGAAAISSQWVATLSTVFIIGCLLIAGGVVQVISAMLARSWRGFFIHLLAGIVHVIVGGLMIEHPVGTAAAFTLMLAAAFIVGGAFRIVYVLLERMASWPWVLLNGVVSLLLGLAIWRQWPEASIWVIGMFIGIELIFTGWSWVMLALAVRSSGPATT